MNSLMTVQELATFLHENQIPWTGRVKRQNLDKSFRWAVDEDIKPSELVLELKNNKQVVASINVSRLIIQYEEPVQILKGKSTITKYKDYSDKWFSYQKQICVNDAKKRKNFKQNLQNEFLAKRSRILTEYQNDLALAKENRDQKISKLNEQYEKLGVNTSVDANNKEIAPNQIYAKIYMNNGNLVLENCGKRVRGSNVPASVGRGNKGPVVIGKNHIAISKEARSALKYVIENGTHIDEEIGDIAIYLNSDKQVVLCWKGQNRREINPYNLQSIEIGYGDIKPNVSLLNELIVEPNTQLQDSQFSKDELSK